MGNQIARQFANLPPEEAAEAVAAHLEAFWEHRMLTTLEALVSRGEAGLDPVLVEAARRLGGAPSAEGDPAPRQAPV